MVKSIVNYVDSRAPVKNKERWYQPKLSLVNKLEKLLEESRVLDNIKKGDSANNGIVESPDKIVSMKLMADKAFPSLKGLTAKYLHSNKFLYLILEYFLALLQLEHIRFISLNDQRRVNSNKAEKAANSVS